MNKYGSTAIRAVEICTNEKIDPILAWEKASNEFFQSEVSKSKGCPKNTFLGLCEKGLVVGIAEGKYTRSKKNKEYAILAVNKLRKESSKDITAIDLWKSIDNGIKKHNSQMDVVLALFNKGLLILK